MPQRTERKKYNALSITVHIGRDSVSQFLIKYKRYLAACPTKKTVCREYAFIVPVVKFNQHHLLARRIRLTAVHFHFAVTFS